MSKPKISLEDFRNKYWKTVCKEVEKNTLVLAMSKDWVTFEAARAVDSTGPESAASIILAGLCVKDWGANETAHKAVDIYQGVYKRAGISEPSLFSDMKYWLAWSSHGVRELKWPLRKVEFEDDGKWAGLANVMLHLSARELMEEGSNTALLGGHAVAKFLKIGMAKKRKKFGE